MDWRVVTALALCAVALGSHEIPDTFVEADMVVTEDNPQAEALRDLNDELDTKHKFGKNLKKGVKKVGKTAKKGAMAVGKIAKSLINPMKICQTVTKKAAKKLSAKASSTACEPICGEAGAAASAASPLVGVVVAGGCGAACAAALKTALKAAEKAATKDGGTFDPSTWFSGFVCKKLAHKLSGVVKKLG
eukprot:TRINITY_DN28234_c0_g1_i2.p1 TRINITY_DN28234_c0_g1~~TRINITY_DN28234_c0_g1_i2.p1  ORF type:complete len:190 (+),score=73.86 TRINITY_DN28234_c0_g1_i2:168-737(+)